MTKKEFVFIATAVSIIVPGLVGGLGWYYFGDLIGVASIVKVWIYVTVVVTPIMFLSYFSLAARGDILDVDPPEWALRKFKNPDDMPFSTQYIEYYKKRLRERELQKQAEIEAQGGNPTTPSSGDPQQGNRP